MRYNEGPGLKLGESFVFHPGLAVEGRFDSNALYEETGVDAAGYLRVIGHLDLSTLSPQRLTDGDGVVHAGRTADFRLKSAVSFREYFSSNENVKAQRAVEADVGLLLALFPQGVFSCDLGADYARTVTARYMETRDNLSRDTARAGVRFKLAPGGGRLTFALGYNLNFDLFEDKSLAGANKIFHDIALNAKWRILPKTAITLDVIEQIVTYYDRAGGIFSNPNFQNSDSKPLRIYAGLVGLITPQLSTILKLGYGNGFYNNGPSYNNILAIAELGYQIGPLAKIKLGYEHLFLDSMIANYFTDERIYLGYDHLIANRFVAHAVGEYRYRQYSELPSDLGAPRLKQSIVGLAVGLDYQIKEWIYVGVGYDLQLQSRISGPNDTDVAAPSYTKHQVYGTVGVSY
jgi:hypothetical protein